MSKYELKYEKALVKIEEYEIDLKAWLDFVTEHIKDNKGTITIGDILDGNLSDELILVAEAIEKAQKYDELIDFLGEDGRIYKPIEPSIYEMKPRVKVPKLEKISKYWDGKFEEELIKRSGKVFKLTDQKHSPFPERVEDPNCDIVKLLEQEGEEQE